MMKVFICPDCGWLRPVSRRKDVECYKCEGRQMELTKLDYEKYAFLSEQERQDYSESWLYIHRKH